MATKEELGKQATELGIELKGDETKAELETLITEKTKDAGSATGTGNGTAPVVEKEAMIPVSDVKKLIAEALANHDSSKTIPKPKRSTEHLVQVHRFDGQWVIDFVDRNKDPYVKQKVHAFDKYNAEKREREAWIELVLAPEDAVEGHEAKEGRTLELPLNRYIQHRTSIFCPIIERKKFDQSYSIGDIEQQKWVNDRKVPSGVMVDQEVTKYFEVFKVKTPDNVERTLGDYAIC